MRRKLESITHRLSYQSTVELYALGNRLVNTYNRLVAEFLILCLVILLLRSIHAVIEVLLPKFVPYLKESKINEVIESSKN